MIKSWLVDYSWLWLINHDIDYYMDHLRYTIDYGWLIHIACFLRYSWLLVGGLNPSEKNMNVNWDDDIPNIWENKIDGNQTTNQINCSWW